MDTDRELYVCQAEDTGRCDLATGECVGTQHRCNYDDGHDERLHECACGHQWPNQPEEN
jgi:hypothetical protein